MSDQNPNLPDPVPPAGAEPVPPAQQPVPPAINQPVPPAGATPVPPAQQPVPPAQQPVPPAGAMPVPPAQQQPVPGAVPVPPAQQPVAPAQQPGYENIQPQPPVQPGFDTVQLQPSPTPQPQQPTPQIPPITQAAAAVGAGGAMPARKNPSGGRRSSTKKRSSKKAASSRAGARPGYQRKPQPVASDFSMMSVFMGIIGIALLGASIWALLPKSLIHIDGYPSDDMTTKEPKNLLAEGQKLLLTRTQDATFSEKEVNDYLNFRLQASQNGALGGMMKIRGIYVDLRPDEAEIFIERSMPLLGRTTISSVVKSDFNSQKHEQSWKTGGGSIGRFGMADKSLQPVLNAFLRMSKVGSQELEVMNYMADIKLGEDTITLDSSL